MKKTNIEMEKLHAIFKTLDALAHEIHRRISSINKNLLSCLCCPC